MLTGDLSVNCEASDTASVLSLSSSMPVEMPFDFVLKMQMKLKIADSPVRCLTAVR